MLGYHLNRDRLASRRAGADDQLRWVGAQLVKATDEIVVVLARPETLLGIRSML